MDNIKTITQLDYDVLEKIAGKDVRMKRVVRYLKTLGVKDIYNIPNYRQKFGKKPYAETIFIYGQGGSYDFKHKGIGYVYINKGTISVLGPAGNPNEDTPYPLYYLSSMYTKYLEKKWLEANPGVNPLWIYSKMQIYECITDTARKHRMTVNETIESLKQDYPELPEIYKKAEEKKSTNDFMKAHSVTLVMDENERKELHNLLGD